MYEQLIGFLLHIVVPIFVVGILVSRVIMQRRAHRRAAQDASRLALGLRIELLALRELYRENLDLITQGARCLLSTRAATSFYKANLGRLVSLFPEPALVAVVSIYTENDQVEAHLAAACTRPNGGFAYQVNPAAAPLQVIKSKYTRGCQSIDAAVAALGDLLLKDTPPDERGAPSFVVPAAAAASENGE